MKTKLWIMWGVLSATTVLVGLLGGSKELVYGYAFLSAGAGWAAFLLPRR